MPRARGRIKRYNVATNESKSIKPYPYSGEDKLRFNWNTPVNISPNDSKVMYIGAQYLYRSSDRGDSWTGYRPI